MKRICVLVAILLIAAGSLYLAQHRKRRDVVSVNAVVDAAADWQRDLSRAPMHLTRISDNEEVRIGDELAQQYASAAPDESASNAAMERYLNEVGSRVAAHAHRKLAFRFHLIASADLINAFALPGGHVFVGQGLLDQMTSEDELAFVLGHEIEHIDHYHAVERVQIEAQLNHLNLDLLAEIAQIPVSLWQAGYSKEEEFEADREGLRIANAAGYSAQGAVNLLERWVHLHDEYVTHAETPPEALSKLAIDGLSGYFRTHPLPSERLAPAREVIAQDHLPLSKSLKPFHVEYEVTNGEQ
jgi:predicted Zn-dependent protease